MGKARHGRCRRGVRSALGSIGRPGAGTKEVRQRFWREVAVGVSSERAAELAGVSAAVGARLFRQGGGVPDVSLDVPSDRFLSLSEREDIALLRAQGHGVREIARRTERHASTISRELRRNAATRGGYVEYRATVAQVRISAIVDACFRLIVDGKTDVAVVAPGRRAGTGLTVAEASTISLKRPCVVRWSGLVLNPT